MFWYVYEMKTQHRTAETREVLLEAAIACFAQHGYDATGVAEICAAAGMSKGAFYHHFPSKQALFLELLNRWLSDLDEQIRAVRASAGTTVKALERMSQMLEPIIREQRSQLPILFEFWTQAQRDPAVWQAAVEPYRRYQAFFAAMIREGVGEGVFKPVDADMAARMLIALAIGLLLQGIVDPDGADWGNIAQVSVRLFLRSLAPDADSAVSDL